MLLAKLAPEYTANVALVICQCQSLLAVNSAQNIFLDGWSEKISAI
jgi:hypothetical protein